MAQRSGLPLNELQIDASVQATYPDTERTVPMFKVSHDLSGQSFTVILDQQGQELDDATLMNEERAAHASKYGRLAPGLAKKLAAVADETPLPLSIWLKEPNYDPPRPPQEFNSKQEAKDFLQQAAAQRAASVTPLQKPVAERLRQLGYDVVLDESAPLLYATLPPSVIREVNTWEQVDQIYLAEITSPALDIARKVIKADTVQSNGITGTGAEVGVVEIGNALTLSNPNLGSNVVLDETYSVGCSSPFPDHGAEVTGIIKSTNTTLKGIAYNAKAWYGASCSGLDTETNALSNKAIQWGANVLNLSFARNTNQSVDALARFYDNLVRTKYVSVVAAAGNENCVSGGNGNITTPGVAYNVITVGAFDDKNTTTWSDDVMDGCSSWRDPTSLGNDREKPEVVAPGKNIMTLSNSSPWTTSASGTSFAAPMVTGMIALMFQRDCCTLFIAPEMTKAIVLASAIHNIEGSSRLSELDGVGAILADRADSIIRRSNAYWDHTVLSCSSSTTSVDATTMSLTSGTRTRVAIAWSTNTSYPDYASRPSTDIDLEVVNSSGVVVASSRSFDNTYEIVDFTPSSSGTYKLRVKKNRCDYDTTVDVGYAWRKGS